MKNLTSLLTLSLLLAHVSPSQGDWFYDFDDGIIPDTFITNSVDNSLATPSDTFQASADGGVLRMWDTASPGSGGTKIAIGYSEEVFHGDVRLSAEINSTAVSDDWIGLQARVSFPYANDPKYFARITFKSQDSDRGILYVGKDLSSTAMVAVSTSWRAPLLQQSYFMEIEVTDDPVTGFPEVTGRLFDHQGGTLLAAASTVDSNLGGIPPIESGMALASLWTYYGETINGTFDNIRAESLAPYLLGDMNLDGAVNGLDVDPFVEAVISGDPQPASPFIAAVLGGNAEPVPEPSTLLLILIALGVVGMSLIPAGKVSS
jgi:hypothetical protein